MDRIRRKIKQKIEKVGFTVVELIVVMVVVSIVSTMSYSAYSGVQGRADNVRRLMDIRYVMELLENYATEHDGRYPATTEKNHSNWKAIDVFTDSNCFNGSAQTDWIPGFDNLPQSVPNTGNTEGVDGPGCYLYASNGESYVVSAWNMVHEPQTDTMYSRQGFRSFQTPTSEQFYTCNDNVTGGWVKTSQYEIDSDYYRHSYTITNIKGCDEIEPEDM